jgi:hypothetical protein
MIKYLFFFIALMASVCSSLKISHDYDKQADFASLKTYPYSEDSRKLPVNDLNKSRIFAAIDKEMAAKGFTKSDNSYVLVDMYLRAKQKSESTAATSGPAYNG